MLAVQISIFFFLQEPSFRYQYLGLVIVAYVYASHLSSKEHQNYRELIKWCIARTTVKATETAVPGDTNIGLLSRFRDWR